METEHTTTERLFWLEWVWLTAIGYAVGHWGGFILGHFFLGNVMIDVCTGAGVGFMQWRAVRHIVGPSKFWVFASIAGLSVSHVGYMIVHHVWGYSFNMSWPSGVVGLAIAMAVAGALIGMMQQRQLRRHMNQSVWWIVANTVSWSLIVFVQAIAAKTLTYQIPPLAVTLVVLLSPAVAGAILGTITGGVLTWLRHQPIGEKVN